jgi:transposase
VSRYIKVSVVSDEEYSFRQTTRGRPGPKTKYVRKTRKFFRLTWELDEDTIAYDRKSDGMYPLLTNDSSLTSAQVLEAHKRQPSIEKRFEQTKTVFEIAPVFLKNEDRVEALFFVYFLALLVQSLIEREIRLGMKRENIESLPLYPEERLCHRPTSEQIFRLFSITQRNSLIHTGMVVRVFDPELTPLQLQVLELLGIPAGVYLSSP